MHLPEMRVSACKEEGEQMSEILEPVNPATQTLESVRRAWEFWSSLYPRHTVVLSLEEKAIVLKGMCRYG